MRAAQMYEEEEISAEGPELNLGLGSVLGIFFGLALVCGVFFGFGYMLGHRNPSPHPAAEIAGAAAPKAQAVAPKPTAQVLTEPQNANRVIIPSTTSIAEDAPAPTSTVNRGLAQGNPPAATGQELTDNATPDPAGTIMVQIAAVKNRTDAEALSSALRKNGFTPTIRSEAQDKLLHVQVGPFLTRDQARTMRQRLSSAGYNAFIK